MQHKWVLLVAGVALAGNSNAHAGAPAWCKATAQFNPEQYAGAQDDRDRVRDIVRSCQPDAGGAFDKARVALEKRLAMTDADWADAVAWSDDDDPLKDLAKTPAASTFATASPLDQYIIIRNETIDRPSMGAMYLADSFETTLTESGRLAFLAACGDRDHDNPVYWATCQGDIAKLDLAKLGAEIRGDKSHNAVERTSMHLRVGKTLDALKDADAKYKALIKKDDAYKKLLDEAAKGRTLWEQTIAPQKDLLALVQQVDSATYYRSRKQFEGCEDKAWAAVTAAAAKIPASSFKGMHDTDNPLQGFAQAAAPIITQDPSLDVAAGALAVCSPKTGMGTYLAHAVSRTPGYHGPRVAAFQAVFSQKFPLDDMNAKEIHMPYADDGNFNPEPYDASQPFSRSVVVSKVTPKGDYVQISQPKASVTTEDCTAYRETNKIIDFDTAGRPVYQSFCTKTSMVKHDKTGADYKVTPRTAAWVKPGDTFSITDNISGPGDIIAVWAKGSKLPTILLGAKIK